jgi:hypothetical protein
MSLQVVPTSLPRPKHGKPIESVELSVVFRTNRRTAARIKDLVPSVNLRSGGCEVVIEGENPGEVAERAKEILDKVRSVIDSPERL